MTDFLDNIFQEIKFTLLGHILNPFWNPRIKRRRVRGKHSYAKVRHYLEKYWTFIKGLQPKDIPTTLLKGEDKIFSIWFQGEEKAPELVKVCFKRLKDTYGNRFVVLDSKTIWEWITLPASIKSKYEAGKITHAHFSDICRVALLYQNGGMWFDATDFLTHRVPQWIEDADLFIYNEGNTITPGTFIQSCFMRAKKGHPLMGMWLDFIYEYWDKENKLIHYFLLHYMLRFMVENNDNAAALFNAMPNINQDPTHVLWYFHQNDPYSDTLYEIDTQGSFFQKTSFKGKNAKKPVPKSVADTIMAGKAKGVKNG